MSVKDFICGNCRHYDPDECYCMASGEHYMGEEDTCDNWEDEVGDCPTEDEKREIIGDREAHRRMVEGDEIE